MSLPELSQIKNKRKILDVTQKQLAEETEVSQSLIAKIEAGTIQPNYASAKRILETLARLEAERFSLRERTAREVMTKNIVSCTSSQTAREACERMIKHNISQIPIFENERVVGSITERSIIAAQTNHGAEKTLNMPLSRIMEPPFPIVDASAPTSTFTGLLRHYQAILVAIKGKILGIVSRANILGK